MENAFGRVVSVIVMAFAIFIVPVLINIEKVNYIKTIAVTSKTVEFVDNVRNHGFIDAEVYDRYKHELSALGIIGDIELERKSHGLYDQENVWISENSREIEENIYSTGSYDFRIGDYFKVVVYAKNNQMQEVLAYYGGSIRNERS